MVGYDFSICKFCETRGADPRYRIHDGINIFCCPSCGGHYIDYLDDIRTNLGNAAFTPAEFSQRDFEYIDSQLQGNMDRFREKVDLLLSFYPHGDLHILDVGAGGGLFIHLLRELGVSGYGIEPNPLRAWFARKKYGLDLSSQLIDDAYWQEGFSHFFDAVTLWDVIEHVNFPRETLVSVKNLLKNDGLLLLDTPARDAFYYRVGGLSYRLTRGKCPSFLDVLYSRDAFSHKQIFSSEQLSGLLEQCGFEVITLKKVHELSFPHAFYLKRLLHSDRIAAFLGPCARVFFKVARIHNKIVVVARARSKRRRGHTKTPHVNRSGSVMANT